MSNGKPKTIKFIYNRLPTYRTYNVDGIYGGVSRRDKLFVEFFSEKPPMPESVVHEISGTGELGKEMADRQPGTIVREIEGGIYLDIPTAKVFADWLIAKINQHESLFKKDK